jgi:homoserine/homoserine lactone efflux protein
MGLACPALAQTCAALHKRPMSIAAYIAYCLTCLALALAPGPTVTIIIANALRSGMPAANRLIFGTVLGMLLWLAIATFGIAGLVRSMGIWFDLLRYAGAAYVIWLGIGLVFQTKGFSTVGDQGRGGSYIAQGFLVILSNPKMFALYLVIIPPLLGQFDSPASGTLLLGGTFVIVATLCDFAYAVLGAQAGQWLMQKSHLRTIELVSGICLIAAGLWLGLKH